MINTCTAEELENSKKSYHYAIELLESGKIAEYKRNADELKSEYETLKYKKRNEVEKQNKVEFDNDATLKTYRKIKRFLMLMAIVWLVAFFLVNGMYGAIQGPVIPITVLGIGNLLAFAFMIFKYSDVKNEKNSELNSKVLSAINEVDKEYKEEIDKLKKQFPSCDIEYCPACRSNGVTKYMTTDGEMRYRTQYICAFDKKGCGEFGGDLEYGFYYTACKFCKCDRAK